MMRRQREKIIQVGTEDKYLQLYFSAQKLKTPEHATQQLKFRNTTLLQRYPQRERDTSTNTQSADHGT